MNTIEIMKLVGKISTSNDGGMSVIASILKQKGYKAMILQLGHDDTCTSEGYTHEVIEDYRQKKLLLKEVAQDYQKLIAENLVLKSKLTSNGISY